MFRLLGPMLEKVRPDHAIRSERHSYYQMGLTTFTSFHDPHVPLTDVDYFTENFQRGKKKKSIVGIRTHAHSFHQPVQLLLGYQIALV